MKGPAATARIGGVAVRLHLVSVVVFAIAIWGVTAAPVESRTDHLRDAGVVGAEIVALLLVHLVVRIAAYRVFGASIRSVALLLFGGSIDLRDESRRQSGDAFAGAAGLLVAIFAATAALGGGPRLALFPAASTPAGGALRVGVVGFALLQALPASPLDAGRLLRSLSWAWSQSATVSERLTAAVTHIIAAGVVAYGLFVLSLEGSRPFWGLAATAAGLQLSLSSIESARTSRWLRESRTMTLADAGFSSAGTISGDLLVADAIDTLRAGGEHVALVVVNALGEPVAVVRWPDLRRARRSEWDVRTVGEIARPLTEMAAVPSSATIQDAVAILESTRQAVSLVTDRGRIVAAVTRDRLLAPLDRGRS